MHTQTMDLFLVDELEDAKRTGELAEGDVDALMRVADWINSFVIRPHEDIGRAGPVCPFVPGSLERKTLWLAAEQVADKGISDVVQLMEGYKRRLLETPPVDGQDVDYKVIVVVFTDLPAVRAQGVFDDVLERIAIPSYVDDGIVFGPFFQGNQGTAIYNESFMPFQSPVPFIFVRHGVVGDWKFFLGKPDWLDHWARRFGTSAVHALADELRRLPWNSRRD